MIKQQSREAITQKDQLVEEMVNKAYKLMRQLGQFETVHQIFGKLPISRIEKEQYQFLFDSVRQNVTEIINQQDILQKMLKQEDEAIKLIDIKTYKDKKFLEKNVSKNTTTFGNYDFSHLIQGIFSEKTPSGRPIFKAILYVKNQERGEQIYGETEPFLPNQAYINIKQVKHQIADIKLLLEDGGRRLKKFDFEFADQNRVDFRSRSYPSAYDIDKRAEILAKLFLLHLYREEGRKAKQIYRSNQIQMNKQRQIRKIKQQMDLEKLKEGEMIQEMDLIKQVYKILMLIEKKMNQLAYNEFYDNKDGKKAAVIKQSLQKIKKKVHEQPSAKNKLKILITYKHQKGW